MIDQVGSKEFTKKLSSEGDDRLRVKIDIVKGRVIEIVCSV
jgi:hypothetical protein